MSDAKKPSDQREALPQPTDADLEKQVEALEAQVSYLQSAIARARRVRLGIFFGFLLLVVVISFTFYGLANRVREEAYLNELQTLAQERLEEKSDMYGDQVRMLVDASIPELKTAFLEQVKKDTPAYTSALHAERATLQANLTQRLQDQVAEHYRAILQEHRGIIKEEFPELTDEQLGRIVLNLETATQSLVKKYYIDEMRQELESLYATWDEFPVVDPPRPNDPKLEDQLVGYMLEIMTLKVAGASEQTEL